MGRQPDKEEPMRESESHFSSNDCFCVIGETRVIGTFFSENILSQFFFIEL